MRRVVMAPPMTGSRTNGDPDAVVVGAGPNGLAAAITLARAGLSVAVFEAADTVGGGTRTAELTLPGFRHDICSAIHPLALGSPFLSSLPLAEQGLELIEPALAAAHPLDGGRAAILSRSLDATAAALGPDGPAYRRLFAPLAGGAQALLGEILGPLRPPRHPLALARFGLLALRSCAGLASARFEGEPARALFAGMAAHSMLSLRQPSSAAAGLMFPTLAHAGGWPIARGGSQAIADAMASYLRSLGGEITTGRRVESLGELPRARTVLCDVTPRQLLAMAGDRLPPGYRRRLGRYRYGPGVFKLDYALEGAVPWAAADCGRAGTVHVGGAMEEIVDAEGTVARGGHPERPFVLVAQQSLFDASRAPDGKHTLWAYCHVPNGSTVDMTERIERQIERFAPGFRDRVLARNVMFPADVERRNANYVGGDINGGLMDLRQLYTRPVARPVPYSTPAKGLYICSSSTPPGGGVHGMCGYFAARAALWALGHRRLGSHDAWPQAAAGATE